MRVGEGLTRGGGEKMLANAAVASARIGYLSTEPVASCWRDPGLIARAKSRREERSIADDAQGGVHGHFAAGFSLVDCFKRSSLGPMYL